MRKKFGWNVGAGNSADTGSPAGPSSNIVGGPDTPSKVGKRKGAPAAKKPRGKKAKEEPQAEPKFELKSEGDDEDKGFGVEI